MILASAVHEEPEFDTSDVVHGVEDSEVQPPAVAAEDAVPFCRNGPENDATAPHPRQLHHALEVAAVVLGGSAASPAFSRQQRPDQSPFLVRRTDPFAQGFLQKETLDQASRSSQLRTGKR
jgi:hypothetical protein